MDVPNEFSAILLISGLRGDPVLLGCFEYVDSRLLSINVYSSWLDSHALKI